MRIQKKYRFSLIGLSILFLMMSFIYIKQKLVEKEIKENPIVTVAYVYKLVDKRSITNVYYQYYYNEEKYSSVELTNLNVTQDIVGKYFEVIISSKDPSASRIQLKKNVFDSHFKSDSGCFFLRFRSHFRNSFQRRNEKKYSTCIR